MFRVTCFLTVAVVGVMGASAPFIRPCPVTDSACIISSAQAAVPYLAPGIPELGVAQMDPMFLDYVASEEKGLKLSMTNTSVAGMKDCSVDNLKVDSSKGKISIVFRCSVTLDGWYKLAGRLIILPIEGHGKYNIKIRDIIIKTVSEVAEVTGADGKPHWHITKTKHNFDVKTGTRFMFENLFNGNKLLAEPVANFANNNWHDVMLEVAPPIVKAIVNRVIDAVEAFFKAVPLDELRQN